MTDTTYNGWTIHPNLEEAKKAVKDYLEENRKLCERFGVRESVDDCCLDISVCVEYLDENGKLKTYSDF